MSEKDKREVRPEPASFGSYEEYRQAFPCQESRPPSERDHQKHRIGEIDKKYEAEKEKDHRFPEAHRTREIKDRNKDNDRSR